MTTIALIDDQRDGLADLRHLLQAESLKVETFKDGQFALDAFHRRMPDMILIKLPTLRIDAVTLVERIRAKSEVPVIMMSAVRDEVEEIIGLRFGADTFFHLPASPRLLAERIKAILRRHAALLAHSSARPEKIISCGDLLLDPSRYSVTWKGSAVTLTTTEFTLLEALAKFPGIVKTREKLTDACYPNGVYVDDRTIDSHIKRLRKKMRDVDAGFDSIETLYGVGYRFTSTFRKVGLKPVTTASLSNAYPSLPAASVQATIQSWINPNDESGQVAIVEKMVGIGIQRAVAKAGSVANKFC